MAGKRTIPTDIEREIVARYVAGEKAGALAAEYGINRKTVTTLVRRNGGRVRHQGSDSGAPRFPDAEWQARVTALRDEGLSQADIGKQLGMSQAVVSRILRRAGYPTVISRSGDKHGSWKGGRHRNELGYVLVWMEPTDPFAPDMRLSNGYVLEHRIVMARAIGRPLRRSETVHHINGRRDDNRIGNLQLRQGRHGKGVAFRCADCGSHNVESVELIDAITYRCQACGMPAIVTEDNVERKCDCDAPILAELGGHATWR